MKYLVIGIFAFLLVLGMSSPGMATEVVFRATGTVSSGDVGDGPYGGATVGDAVEIEVFIDSESLEYLDPDHMVRYLVIGGEVAVNDVAIPIVADGATYFTMRNDHWVVDGIVNSWPLTESGHSCKLDFTTTVDTWFTSLEILENLGFWTVGTDLPISSYWLQINTPYGNLEYNPETFAILVENNCPGDANGDGSVNVTDMLALLASWGSCNGCPTDSNSDGLVDVTDLLTLLAAWGSC